ncbi:hypothetical protein ACVDFE_02405 [Lentzea chajnantorensis]
MWTINKTEQLSSCGGVSQMSHREEPRSGRGCFGAVVVVPFLALTGMFALIALTGSPEEAPLAAPPATRPTSQWWTEPFDALTTSTITETVVVQGQARELKGARPATRTRVVGTTVTETVRVPVSSSKPSAVGRNEEPDVPGDEDSSVSPSTSDSSRPVVTSSVVPPPPPSSASVVPSETTVPSSAPGRARPGSTADPSQPSASASHRNQA